MSKQIIIDYDEYLKLQDTSDRYFKVRNKLKEHLITLYDEQRRKQVLKIRIDDELNEYLADEFTK